MQGSKLFDKQLQSLIYKSPDYAFIVLTTGMWNLLIILMPTGDRLVSSTTVHYLSVSTAETQTWRSQWQGCSCAEWLLNIAVAAFLLRDGASCSILTDSLKLDCSVYKFEDCQLEHTPFCCWLLCPLWHQDGQLWPLLFLCLLESPLNGMLSIPFPLHIPIDCWTALQGMLLKGPHMWKNADVYKGRIRSTRKQVAMQSEYH